jgi:hypothetical protein
MTLDENTKAKFWRNVDTGSVDGCWPQRFAAGEQKVSLAKSFGVSDVAIFKIVTRKTWRHVA